MADVVPNDITDPVEALNFCVNDAIKRFGDYGRASDTDPRLIPKSDNWFAIQLFKEWAAIGDVVDFNIFVNSGGFFSGKNEELLTEWKSELNRFHVKCGGVIANKIDNPFGELSHDEAFLFWEELSIFAIRIAGSTDFAQSNGSFGSALEAVDESFKELPDRVASMTSEIAELLASLVANAVKGALSGFFKGLGVVGTVLGVAASGLTIWYIVKNKKAVV